MAGEHQPDRPRGVRMSAWQWAMRLTVIAGCVVVAVSDSAEAQFNGATQPETQHALTPAGETEVNYFSGGSLTHSTQIPADSAFNTSGRGAGGGGAAQPCY